MIKKKKVEDLKLLSITEILNQIGEYSGDSLLEKMMDFCETNQIDEQELGDILEETEVFKALLYRDCVKNRYIKDEVIETKIEQMQGLDVW